MAKRKRKAAFETGRESKQSHRRRSPAPASPGFNEGGVFGFFRDFGVRETIESILIAVVLALMFRTFEAEAFIIPTGSMAPALQGQHMDIVCSQCGYEYRTGSSYDSSNTPADRRRSVSATFCPICQYEMMMDRSNPDHRSFNGDRILVNKFVYDFTAPKRFDVIVFKNPNNGKQNYIKRLIGLPNDKLLIENGDVFNMLPQGDGGWLREIIRKPAEKLRVMLQLVHDNHFYGEKLRAVQWPARWQPWTNKQESHWELIEAEGHWVYLNDGKASKVDWLSYRHVRPRSDDWPEIEALKLPDWVKDFRGQLITDYYEYNDKIYRGVGGSPPFADRNPGFHWVGDLASEVEIEVQSDSGEIYLRAVEGGAKFDFAIDVSTGDVTVTCSDQTVRFGDQATSATGRSNLKGAGRYKILFANADDRVYLWVNNRLVEFDHPAYTRTSPVLPQWSEDDPGDAEPLAVGVRNADVRVERLKVLRDIYYTAATAKSQINAEFLPPHDGDLTLAERAKIHERMVINQNPQLWSNPQTQQILLEGKGRKEPMFPLGDGQLFPMGDNSPASLDARVWPGPKFLDEEFLIGRAMFIYWPHSLNRPIPYFPNFRRMGFIR